MADGERDQAHLELQLVELTRRISEIEARIASIESKPAGAADRAAVRGDAAQPASTRPLAQQDPWRDTPAQQRWSPAQQGWVPPQPPAQRPQPAPLQPQQARPTAPPPRPAPAQPEQQARNQPIPGWTTGRVQQPAAPPSGWVNPKKPASGPPQGQWALPESGISLASLRDLESRLTGRLLAWVGAMAVLLGSVFFLSLAMSRGWIGPEGRVVLGISGGSAFLAAGEWLFGRKQASLGHVMVAVGLGVVSLSLFAGTRFYNLYPPEWALAGSFAVAVVAAMIAIQFESEPLAVFGLLAVAAAPPIMGAGANAVTIAFLAVTVVGTTVISLAKAWRWLPPTAFLITAPQLLFWLVSKPDGLTAVLALATYWLLHAVAASADELRPHDQDAEVRAESLFLANSLVAIGGGLYALSGDLAAWQGAFVAAAALAHFAFAGYFVWRRGDAHPFGIFIGAIGVTAVAIAIERQFDGSAVVIGWAIEAAVLAAVFGYRRNVYAGAAAAILGTLEIAHLLAYEYSWLHWSLAGGSGTGPFPFANSAGIALGGVLIAALAAGWACRRNDVRVVLLIVGSLLSAYSLPYELSGPALIAGWAIEGAALAGVWRSRRVDYLGWTAVVIGALAVLHLGVYEYPWIHWSLEGATGPGAFPFADSAGLALGCALAAGAVAGWLSRSRVVRFGLVVAGALIVAYSLPFELSGPALVAGWSAEAVALAAVYGFRRNVAVASVAAVAGVLAVAQLGGYEYPLLDWSLRGAAGSGQFAFADSAGLALGCLLVAAALVGVLSRTHDVRCGMTTAGLLLVAYALPFELSGAALVAGWAVLLPASIAAEALLDRLPGVPASRALQRQTPVILMNDVHLPDSPLLPALAAAFLALAHMLVYEIPLSSAQAIVLPAVPFVDLATASAMMGIVAFLAAAAITPRPDLRVGAILVASALAAYTMVFELALPYAVVGWCALALTLGLWSVWSRYGRRTYASGGGVLVAASALAILAQIVPLDRLGVQAAVGSTGVWFALNSILAIGATAATVAAGARYLPLDKTYRSALVLAVGIGLVYLASALLVDFFQGRVGGHTALEELQKQAQVSVSILWGIIGMAVFLAGIISWRQGIREGGLGLLGLATGKVFLFDLSYLDVAYRVLSLIGLGLVLLLGAYAYQSLRPHRPTPDEPADVPSEAPVG